MIFFLLFSILIFSLFLTYLLENIFKKFSLFIDTPSSRSCHKLPTPTSGGLSILFSFFFYLFFLLKLDYINIGIFSVLTLAVFPLIIIGLIDDLKNINMLYRLVTQFLSSFLLVYVFYINNSFYYTDNFSQQYLVTIFLLILLSIWLMNLYNFMDGIDGYASSECIFVSFAASALAYLNDADNYMYLYLLGLGFSTLGFLFRNWHPAKIFMGDTGSVSIGCIFIFFIFYSAAESILSIYTWLILLAVFISDSTYTLFVRILTKKNIFMPHLTHAFHILTINKNSQLFTNKVMIFLNIFWIFPLALLSNIYSQYHIIITFFVYLPLFYYIHKIGAGLDRELRI